MGELEELFVPFVGNTKSSEIPAPEEYNYWWLRKNRHFFIDYEIMEDYSLIELGKTILQMNFEEKDIPKDELKPIYIWVFSYGGDLDQAFCFCDICESSRIPIITVSMGIAMSAGLLIFLSGSRRYALKHSRMLVHSGSAGFQGTAEQIEEAQKDYKKQLNSMKEFILERTDIDAKLFGRNKAKDWYISGEDLLKYHVVDKLIDNIEEIF